MSFTIDWKELTNYSGLYKGRGLSARWNKAFDLSVCKDASEMYKDCKAPVLNSLPDLSHVENLSYAFHNSSVKVLDIKTGSAKSMYRMLSNCSELLVVNELDISSVTDCIGESSFSYGLADYCDKLLAIGKLILPEGGITGYENKYIGIFYNANDWNNHPIYPLRYIRIQGSIRITSDYKYYRIDLSYCPYLSVGSLVSILESLVNEADSTITVVLGSKNIDKLSPEQKLIAINKNIMLA